MGILDAFDSPDFLSRVFGDIAGGGMPAAPPQPPPQPPMQPQAPPMQQASLPTAGGPDVLGGPQPQPPQGPTPAQVVSNHFQNITPQLGVPPPGGGIGSDAARTPNIPQPSWSPSEPPVAGAGPAANPNLAPVAPGGPAPLPPASTFAGGALGTETSGAGLAGALGLDPNRVAAVRQQDGMRAALNGVGKGLTAVGKMPAGATMGQQFAGGLGGSLEGQTEMQQKQQDTHFNQTSAAFKDMMAAKKEDDTAGYRAAQQNYLQARAASLNAMTANGGKGSNAWQNTPYGKVIGVENEAQKFEKGQQIILQKRWALNGATPEQQQEDLDRLGKNVNSYRERLYKSAGIDPKQADKIKDMGLSPDNPFDTKGMSVEQFHSQVPMGGWFKDQNGVVRQRTVAPPGSSNNDGGAPMAGGAGPGQAANYDDATAMTPAA